jgi:hypothetical protein
METAWKRVGGQLSIANGEEFERTALHYLRVIWPMMIQAPRLQRLDRFGVDLCVPDLDTHFQVVVQSKGFKVDEQLLESQVRDQILPSIQKFRNSSLTCDKYILVHNRDGANRLCASQIQSELDLLVRDGKAKSAILWDRSIFVKEVRNHLDSCIRDKLLDRSRLILKQQESFFRFGKIFVSEVPLSQFIWKPGALNQPDFDSCNFVNTQAVKIIASSRDVRYSILIGSFGIGKTTTVLRVADAEGLIPIYVPAYTIFRKKSGQGTNLFLGHLEEGLDLLEDFPADTSEVLRDVIGSVLGRILRQTNEKFVLIIDGIDEHSFYSTPFGLQWLSNELAELCCPIVLTTRREHFLSLIGNYRQATENLSKKGGADRVIEILHLGSWSQGQAQELLLRAIEISQNEEQSNKIRHLLDRITSNTSALSSRLLSHPIFLQITLDLIVEGEDWLLDDENQLMELWARKKIQRDLSKPRLEQIVSVDVDYYTEGMMLSMDGIALEMLDTSKETMNAEKVVEIVREKMGILQLDATAILMTSLLIPASTRRGLVLEMKFFHRKFQEYFTNRSKKF